MSKNSPLRKTIDDLLGELPPDPSDFVTESDLAAHWGVSTRQVRKLLSEGVIQKADTRHFDRTSATQSYIRRLIDQATRKSNPELTAEKLRLTRESADKIAIANELARGELVLAKLVEITWTGILRDVRAAMLAIPTRAAQRLPHLTATDLEILEREVRDALQEMAGKDIDNAGA